LPNISLVPEVGKVTFKSNADGALSADFFFLQKMERQGSIKQ
jgi:hypothetical protein